MHTARRVEVAAGRSVEGVVVFSTEAAGQLHVLGLNCDPLGVDGAHRVVSSNRRIKYASAASCSASSAFAWKRMQAPSVLRLIATSLTTRLNGLFRISRFTLFWYLRTPPRSVHPVVQR